MLIGPAPFILVLLMSTPSEAIVSAGLSPEIENLQKKGDWRQVVVESLRNLKSLDAKSAEAFAIRFRLHRALNKLIGIHVEKTDRTWVDWAIGLGGKSDFFQHQLKFSSFIADFPHSAEAKIVHQWESEAVKDFLRRESEVMDFYLDSGRLFAALFRLEGLINNESILRHQTRGLISQIISIRVSIQKNFDAFEDSQLRQIHVMSEGLAMKPSPFSRKHFIQDFSQKTQAMRRVFRDRFKPSNKK